MRFYLSLLLCAPWVWLSAQTPECTRQLALAEEAFDQGRLLDVIGILSRETGAAKECFPVFSHTERTEALKLLTKVYIFADNIPEAENSLIALLREDKEHRLAKDDPSELHFLYNQFRTEPIFRVGLRFLANKSLPKVLQTFNTFQVGDKKYNQQGVNGGLGLGGGVEALAERHVGGGIEVAAGVQFRLAAYDVEGDLLSEQGRLVYNVTNQSIMLRTPLFLRYTFGYNAMDNNEVPVSNYPYLFAGAAYDLVLDARYINSDRVGGTAFTLNENNSLTAFDQTARSNVSLIGGAGIKFRVGRFRVHFATVELRFDNSLFNYVNPRNRFKNKDIDFSLAHIEDDLTLNTVSLAFGYTLSLYNPAKKKQYR